MATHVYLPIPSRHAGEAAAPDQAQHQEPRPPLSGSRVAILDNGWDAMPALVEHLTRRLREAGVVDVQRIPAFAGRPLPGPALDEVAREVDYSISALGN